jgi:hypothetical protein
VTKLIIFSDTQKTKIPNNQIVTWEIITPGHRLSVEYVTNTLVVVVMNYTKDIHDIKTGACSWHFRIWMFFSVCVLLLSSTPSNKCPVLPIIHQGV